ncbi:MAG: hypothetical protein U5Q44_05265 [Dehalococcoidia bacterium]|nr:hypothetical protein [Dehalococcoidia bacterium]
MGAFVEVTHARNDRRRPVCHPLGGTCSISPDGERVAVQVTTLDREADEYKSAIHVFDVASGEGRQFTYGASGTAHRRGRPTGSGLHRARSGATEKPQIYVMPADGGEARAVTSQPFGAGPPAWSPDSGRLAFSARTGTPTGPGSEEGEA